MLLDSSDPAPFAPTAPPTSSRLPYRKLGSHFVLSVLFNSALALAITAFGPHSLADNMIYSQLIGLGIWAMIDVGRFVLHPDGWGEPKPMCLLVVVSVVISYFAGSAAGDLLLGHRQPARHPHA